MKTGGNRKKKPLKPNTKNWADKVEVVVAKSTKWKTKSSDIVYETPWIKVRRDEVLNHHGKALTYSVVELHHPSVFIVAANDSGAILFQKNYRYTIDQTIWELPAGHSEGKKILE